MKNRLFICLSLAATMFISSCNDDFMNRLPQTDITEDNFFNTEEDLKLYCYGLTSLPSYSYVDDEGTDNTASTSMLELKNMMISGNQTSKTLTDGWDWERLYKINFFLERCAGADVPEATLAHYEGIARYYRAIFYMDMVRRYSDVPWYDKTLSTDDEDLYKARDSREVVVEKIFEDFAYAVEHVETDQLKGEIDKWIVLATQAREALYEGTYRKYHSELNLESTADSFLQLAQSASRRIMDEGSFALHSTGNPDADYYTLFSSLDLTTNKEMIQARYYDYYIASNYFWQGMFGSYQECPTKDIVQAYLMSDGSYYSSHPTYSTNQFVEEFENRDPRIYQTFAYPGWVLENPMTYVVGAGVFVQSLSKNFTGYHQIKGFINVPDQEYYCSIDLPVIRYAEVLLTYAEAKAELGTITQTDLDESVNLIRGRVGMPSMPLNPEADPYMQDKYPNVSPLIQEIRRERRVELAFEGFRFDDLMRYGAGALIEREPEGLYFPSLGKFDLTGDGVEDIYLIPSTEDIPADANKELNSLGTKLTYYKTGTIDDTSAAVYLENGTSGNIVTIKDMGTFEDPKYYYRPVPYHELELNPNLAPQLFGWE
ncbi:MAG: RagB/SusD family nutrient uptake outer membrane protein [Rikenellaceae bacterium]